MDSESNYALYIKEREPSKKIIENKKGFATYIINIRECYLVDVFVKQEYRKSGESFKFVESVAKIAKDAGCKFLTTSASPTAAGSTSSLKVILSHGFELDSSINNLIFFKKEL